ncbi:MAG: protein phosphatase 2C domain-containing protein [Eubacteriales bacterium]|nr:protein phosphatase 2C domain-containing protein [Eubacteriales bacterium]
MLRLRAVGISDIGSTRNKNEDNIYVTGSLREYSYGRQTYVKALEKIADSALFAVCDGMGGEAHGEEAAWISVSGLSMMENHLLRRPRSDFRHLIASYLRQANKRICDRICEYQGRRMGSTFACLYLSHTQFYLANLGDSRIYRWQSGVLEQLSIDHTQAQNLANQGLIPQSAVQFHPDRHALTQHLGIFPQELSLDPYISDALELRHGDFFLLCSDGLSDVLSNRQIAKLLADKKDLRLQAEALVEAALKAGSRDNISLILVEVLDCDEDYLTRQEIKTIESDEIRSNSDLDQDTHPLDVQASLSAVNQAQEHQDRSNLGLEDAAKASTVDCRPKVNSEIDSDIKIYRGPSDKSEPAKERHETQRFSGVDELKISWPKIELEDEVSKSSWQDDLSKTLQSGEQHRSLYEHGYYGKSAKLSETLRLQDEPEGEVTAKPQLTREETVRLSDRFSVRSLAKGDTGLRRSFEDNFDFGENWPQPITTDDLDRFNQARLEAHRRQLKMVAERQEAPEHEEVKRRWRIELFKTVLAIAMLGLALVIAYLLLEHFQK